LILNSKYPDVVHSINQCKMHAKSTSSDHSLISSKPSRSCQLSQKRISRLTD
jgi:hypothetical protein